MKKWKYGAQCRAGFRPTASACWHSSATKAAYVAHAAGTEGTPGGSDDKVSLGRRYEHQLRTVNLHARRGRRRVTWDGYRW
jgi:hypothetical protein